MRFISHNKSGVTPYLKIAVMSFLSALFVTASAAMMIYGKLSFSDKSVFSAVKTPWFFTCLLLIFAVLFAGSLIFRINKAIKILLFISFMTYAVVCCGSSSDTFFCFGVCALLLPVCIFTFKGEDAVRIKKKLSGKALFIICALCVLYLTVFISVETVCRYLSLSSPCFDFGIFAQMFYNMKKTLLPYTTCEREMLLSHFAVHMSPIYYLLLPIYAVFPYPVTVQICQAITLGSGVIPVAFICKSKGLGRKSTALFAVIYALYPAVAGGTYYDIHENCFLLPLLLWLFYFGQRGKALLTLLFSLLVCLVKEDAPVYVMFFCIFVLLSKTDKKKKRAAAISLSLSALYFCAVLFYINKYGQGVMSTRFSNFMADGESSLLSVIINVIKSPAYAVYEIFNVSGTKIDVSKLVFLLQTALPLSFMPFISYRYERLLLLCPLILVDLMPDYVYQHDIFFQYTFGAFAFLLYAAILNYKDMSEDKKRITGIFAVCACVLVCTQTVYRRAVYLNKYVSAKNDYDEVRTVLSDIPEDASVSATSMLCAPLSKRKELYSLNNSNSEHITDYIAVDLRYSDYSKYYDKYKNDSKYELIYFKENWLALLRLNTLNKKE